MAKDGLLIGQLAAHVRMRPSALRYYEQLGLISAPTRIAGNRRYPAATIRRVALIKMAQRAGLSLADIGALLADKNHPAATRQWRALAERKLPEIDATIAELKTLRDVIANCLECGCMNFDACELLSHH